MKKQQKIEPGFLRDLRNALEVKHFTLPPSLRLHGSLTLLHFLFGLRPRPGAAGRKVPAPSGLAADKPASVRLSIALFPASTKIIHN